MSVYVVVARKYTPWLICWVLGPLRYGGVRMTEHYMGVSKNSEF